ncbi:MAG: hypothetical protein EB072_15035 [Betaproteobacteria bacterium]|nr:hypothetical protein [Betaproteobacteria bacterium]
MTTFAKVTWFEDKKIKGIFDHACGWIALGVCYISYYLIFRIVWIDLSESDPSYLVICSD